MKRTELVALSRAAVRRAASNEIGVIGPTKKQLERLAEHKKKKKAVKQPRSVHARRTSS
jgi:hypothetical protein